MGHVLDRVDGAADAKVKKAANDLHRLWRDGDGNAIFRDFIERERNNVLKEYAFDMTEEPVSIIAYLKSQDGFDVVRQFLIEENIYRPMESGAYEGEDGRTLLDEAIALVGRSTRCYGSFECMERRSFESLIRSDWCHTASAAVPSGQVAHSYEGAGA